MENQIRSLIEKFKAGTLSRRELFQRLAFLTGSMLAAKEIVRAHHLPVAPWEEEWRAIQSGQAPPAAQPTPKESIEKGAANVPENVSAEWVKYKSGEVEIDGYLARPKAKGVYGAIIVIHENRGLTEFVLDIAKRWASEGWLALAPDLLSRSGGTQKFDSMQTAMMGIRDLKREDVVSDLHATVNFLKSRGDVKQNKIAVSGFCWGGAQTFNFATESKDVAAAMVFYGSEPNPLEKISNLSCPVLGIYAADDARITSKVPEVEAAMKKAGKSYEYKIFDNTQHAFMNFTGPRHNEAAAKEAWKLVVAFAKKHLS